MRFCHFCYDFLFASVKKAKSQFKRFIILVQIAKLSGTTIHVVTVLFKGMSAR